MTTPKEVLKLLGDPNAYATKICDLIKNVVSTYYELPMSVFEGKSRKRNVIKCKQSSVYFIRQALPKATLQIIGREMRYDHATILHCIKTIKNLLETDKETQIDIAEMSRILEIEQGSVLEKDVDVEKKYYYISMDNCTSIKLLEGKALVLTGFTPEEVRLMMDSTLFLKMQKNSPVEHKNTGLFILQKKD